MGKAGNSHKARLGRCWPFCVMPVLLTLTVSPYSSAFSLPKEALLWCCVLVQALSWEPARRVSLQLVGVGLCLGWACLSLCWSADSVFGLRILLLNGGVVLSSCLLASLIRSYHTEEERLSVFSAVSWSWSMSASCTALLALVQKIGWLGGGLYRVVGSIGNPNRLAALLLLALPMMIWLWVRHGGWMRGVLSLMVVVCLLGVWGTGCQSAWIALFFMMCVAFLLWLRGSWSASIGIRSMLLGACSVSVVCGVCVWLWRASLWESLVGRVWLAGVSLGVWWRSPWVGVGVGGFPHEVAWVQAKWLAQVPAMQGRWTVLMDSHQMVSSVFCQFGLVGVVLALCLCYVFVLGVWRGGLGRLHMRVACVALCGVVVLGLSESLFVSVVCMAQVGCWCVFVGSGRKALRVWDMPIWYRTLVRWGVLFVAVFGVWMTVRWLAGDVLLVQARKVLAKKDLPSTKRAIRMLAQAEVLLGKQAAFDRGIAFRGAAAWVRAARSFEEAFALRPSPEAALSVSGAWFALGRTQRALYWAQLAVYLHPRYARGFHQLGIIYLEKRRMYDAWRCLRRARSLRPGDPRIRHAWRRLPWSWRQR